MDRTVEFNGTKFGKLTRRERAEITRRLLAERRVKLESNLKTSGAPAETVFEQLDGFDFEERRIGSQLFGAYALSDEGIDELLLRGLRRSNPSASQDDVDRLDVDDEAALNLVLKLCNMRLREAAADPDAEGAGPEKPADPSSPACYGEPTATTPTKA